MRHVGHRREALRQAHRLSLEDLPEGRYAVPAARAHGMPVSDL